MHRRPTLGASGCRRRRWSGETASRRSAPRGPRRRFSRGNEIAAELATTPDSRTAPRSARARPRPPIGPVCQLRAHGLGGRPGARVSHPRRGTPARPRQCFYELLQELRARERLLVADELDSVAALAFDTPFDVAPGEQGSGRAAQAGLMASGMESSHRGFAGTVEILSAKGTAGPPSGGGDGFAREASAGTSDRPGRPACGRARGRWRVRLEVGAGGGGSGPGWRHPPRRRRRARPRVAPTAPAPTAGLERPGGPQRACRRTSGPARRRGRGDLRRRLRHRAAAGASDDRSPHHLRERAARSALRRTPPPRSAPAARPASPTPGAGAPTTSASTASSSASPGVLTRRTAAHRFTK